VRDVQVVVPLPGEPGLASFNRVAASTTADVVVLLDAGAQPAPGWLDHLLRALAQPDVGLAGPSTNWCWNEQGVFPNTSGRPAAILATARRAELRFGDATRTLEPLHCLADFCYAVRRDVIDAVGAADEGYGDGPCWEMDYNIRAARAGFRAVWVQAAYVHRAPPSAERRAREDALFEASRRRYQDSFCALRLRGTKDGYEPHCRGEECEHFAPRELIRIHRPLPRAQPAARGRAPLVTCVMPTRGRAELVAQSIEYFRRQDYPALELVIVDDSLPEERPSFPTDDRVRVLQVPRGTSIGAKRNRACEAARGSVIVHWDDDDWYAPSRVSTQVRPLLDGRADVTGFVTDLVLDVARWEFWRCAPTLHRRLFVHDVHGGTLAFNRAVWTGGARYANASLAEDAAFLRAAVRRGARLERLPQRGLFVYVRHGRNAWSFQCGRHVDPSGWLRAPEPSFLAGDRRFYATLGGDGDSPLVSCVMLVHNRPHLIPQAVEYFRRQDYPRAELVVVDDAPQPLDDLLPRDDRIRHVRLDRRHSIGAKRNIGCEAARGDLVAHWDDDDWCAPWRLSYQVADLGHSGGDAAGLGSVLFYEPATHRAWRYEWLRATRPWVHGGTLLYTKDLWTRNPFADVDRGEDARFLWSARRKTLRAHADERFYVGIVHTGNTSPKNTSHRLWQPYDAAEIDVLLGEDAPFYACTRANSPRTSGCF